MIQTQELYAEDLQALADAEFSNWDDLRYSLERLIAAVDDKRTQYKQDTGYVATTEYDRLEEMLDTVYSFIEGHMQEVDPGYAESRWEYRYADSDEKALIRYAKQEGINYIALRKGYPLSVAQDAAEYISEHGLASMNYEATREALRTYRKTALA